MTCDWYTELEGWYWYPDVGRCDYCGEDVEVACHKEPLLNGVEISCPTCEAAGVMYNSGDDYWAYWY